MPSVRYYILQKSRFLITAEGSSSYPNLIPPNPIFARTSIPSTCASGIIQHHSKFTGPATPASDRLINFTVVRRMPKAVFLISAGVKQLLNWSAKTGRGSLPWAKSMGLLTEGLFAANRKDSQNPPAEIYPANPVIRSKNSSLCNFVPSRQKICVNLYASVATCALGNYSKNSLYI